LLDVRSLCGRHRARTGAILIGDFRKERIHEEQSRQRQKAASFNLDDVMKTLQETHK